MLFGKLEGLRPEKQHRVQSALEVLILGWVESLFQEQLDPQVPFPSLCG